MELTADFADYLTLIGADQRTEGCADLRFIISPIPTSHAALRIL